MANTKELVVELSAEMTDFKKAMHNMQVEVQKAMKKVEESAENAGDALDNETKRGAEEAADNVKKGMDEASDHTSKASDTMKKALGAVAGAFAIDKIKDGFLDVMETAANFKAVDSQFSQVFGNVEKEASGSLKTISKNTGIVESNLKGSYTQIAAFSKTTGMDSAEAMGVADRAMVAVADSAAFYDRSIEDVTESMQSFLKGNYENDAALGLSCTETTRNAAANELYGQSFADLSEEQKQLTLLKMVEDANKASGALGQAARESDTWTTATGNLKGAWEQFKANLGAPILDTVSGIINKLADRMQNFSGEGLKNTFAWLKENLPIIATSFGGLFAVIATGTIIQSYTKWLNGLTLAQRLSVTWTNLQTAAQNLLNSAIFACPAFWIVAALAAIAVAFVALYKHCEGFRNAVNSAWEKIKEFGSYLLTALQPAFEFLKQKMIEVKDNFITVWTTIWQGIQPIIETLKIIFNDFVSILSSSFQLAWEKAQPIIETIKTGIIALKDKFIETFTPIGEKISGIVPKFQALWVAIAPIIQWIGEKLLWLWQTILAPFIEGYLKVMFTVILAIFKGAWTVISRIFSSLITVLGVVINAIVSFVLSVIEKITSVINFFKGIPAMISAFIEKVKYFILDLAYNLATRLLEMRNNVSEKVEAIKNFFVNGFQNMREKINEIIDKIKNFFSDRIEKMKEMASELPGKLGDAIANMGKWFANGFIKMINKGIEFLIKGVNKIRSAIKWVADKLGFELGWEDLKVSDYQLDLLAKGTNGWNGGNAIVGEAGREIVRDRGNAFMVNKPTLLNLSKGAQVLSNPKTEKILKSNGINMYASGKDEEGITGWLKDKFESLKDKIGDIFEYIGNEGSLTDLIFDMLDLGDPDGLFAKMGLKFITSLKDKLTNWLSEKLASFASATGAFDGIEQYITSGFGARWGTTHNGIDLAGGPFAAGQPVYSQSDGTVQTSGFSNTAGYWNVIKSGNLTYKYMHMMAGSLTKAAGQMVKAGEQIGKVGNTGNSYGAHLHFQVDKNGVPIDPTQYFTGAGYGLGNSGGSWRQQIISAAAFFGDKLTENEIARVQQQIKTESGGNARAVQSMAVDDINSRTGNLAKGLLQFVPSTFNSYAVSGHNDIWNPFDQLLAFFNNSTWRKALPQLGEKRGWTPRGSKRKARNGGLFLNETDLTVGEKGAEAVVPLSNASALKPFGQSVINALEKEVSNDQETVYEFTIPFTIDGKEFARATATFTQEELDKNAKRKSRYNGVK